MNPGDAVVVVHLVGADASAARLDVLSELCAQSDVGQQLVWHLGPGPIRVPGSIGAVRMHAPLSLDWLGGGALRRQLQRHHLLETGRPAVLHAWSPAAANWCRPLTNGKRPLLIDMELPGSVRQLASWPAYGHVSFVCPTATAQRRLLDQGISACRIALIRPGVNLGTIDPDRRRTARVRFRLGEHDVVVTLLPPATRRTGTFTAVWAALLLEKVRSDVRLVIPADGREQQRAWRLVEACQHERMVRVAAPGVTLPDLLAGSDLAVYLPSGDSPTAGLAWAMAAGVPIVTTAVPSVTELLAAGRSAWLCRPDDPQDAARRMLQALEEPEQSRRQAEQARAQAVGMFSSPRMIAQYRRVYANLAAYRPAGADIGGVRAAT